MSDDLYQVTGGGPDYPENVFDGQAQPDLYQRLGPTAVRAIPDNQTNWLDSFLHHATMGLGDKAEAALKATGVVPGGVPGESFTERYQKDLANARRDIQDYEAANPGWTGAKSAEAAGFLAPMLIAGPEAVAAKSLGQAALRSSATGAGFGAAYGYGGTDDSSLGENLKATGIGALTGGVASPALVVGSGIAKAPFAMGKRATDVFSDEGARTAAGRVIKEAANDHPSVFEKAPLADMKLTAGQSSGNPGLLFLERNVSQATPMGAELASAATAKNNAAIREAMNTLGGPDGDPAKSMMAALEKAHTTRRAANSEIWKKADVSNTGGVSGHQFNNFMKKHIDGLPVADQAIVPPEVVSVMGKMAEAKTQNLSDVQAVRSMLGGMATKAARAGDGNTARVLRGLGDRVEDFIDLKAANLGQKLPLYNEARAHTRDMKETFDQHPDIRAALGVDSHGADKLPLSATADQFIRTGKGAPESFNAYLKAISSKDAQGKITYDKEGLEAAQSAFTQKFLRTVTNSGLDEAGQQLVSPAKMQKFLTDYSHVINSPMFTPAQRDMIGRISKATQMASRTANARPPGGGSDTFQKLQGDKFIDALIGPQATKLLDVTGKVAGTAGGYLEGGAMGALVGNLSGEKAAGMIANLYNAPREKVISIITQAMHDPQLAKDLMMKASNSNAKLLPPPRRAKLFGVVGAQSAPLVVEAATAH